MNKLSILKNKNIFLILSCFILIVIAGFRPIGIDKDSQNYANIIKSNINVNLIDKEPGFWIIKYINDNIFNGNIRTFFLIFTIIGVSLKILAIKKYSLTTTLSVFAYICLYFILHEMTQIRVGVATGIFLLALEDIKKRDFKNYFLKTIIAIFFHYSAFIMIFIYILNPYIINRKLFFFLPLIGILLSLFRNVILNNIISIAHILPEFLSFKLNNYFDLLLNYGTYSEINLFNFYYLSLILFYYYSILNYKKMKSEYDILFIKILGLMLFSFYFLSAIPVLAFRISEFFGIVLIFLIPHIILTIKEKYIACIPLFIWLSVYFVFIMLLQVFRR
ncbi:MAG: EpsG family protein [Spirochaetota bacterium]